MDSMNDDDFAELFRSLPRGSVSESSWQDVASELAALGQTLGDVLRRAWQRQDGDPGVARLREGLQALLQDAGGALEGTPEAQQAREQLAALRDSIRAAAERAGAELRPELVSLLRQANAALRRHTGLDE
jgi:ElaB/YqjD/DUF883 family membrane-anchored ribosome-binding protein